MKITDIEKLDVEALREFVKTNKLEYDLYGLPIIRLENGEEYAIALDDCVAFAACETYIEESLFAFTPSFMAGMTNIPIEIFEALSKTSLCESLNPAYMACIEQTCGFVDFVDAAIRADGRGHFLGIFDGEEIDLPNASAYAYRLS